MRATTYKRLQRFFVLMVGIWLGVTCLSFNRWLVGGLAFSALVLLNGHFLLFPDTAATDLMSRLSLWGILSLVVISLVKFFVLSAL